MTDQADGKLEIPHGARLLSLQIILSSLLVTLEKSDQFDGESLIKLTDGILNHMKENKGEDNFLKAMESVTNDITEPLKMAIEFKKKNDTEKK